MIERHCLHHREPLQDRGGVGSGIPRKSSFGIATHIHANGVVVVGRTAIRTIDTKRAWLREINGIVGREILEFGGTCGLIDHHATVFGGKTAHHFLRIDTIGQRVGIVNLVPKLIDIKAIGCTIERSVGDRVVATLVVHQPVVFECAHRESRNGRIMIDDAVVIAAFQARSQCTQCGAIYGEEE